MRKPPKVVSLAERKHKPHAEDVARLLRAVDGGSPIHPLPNFGMTTLKRAVSRLSNLACTVRIDKSLAATFEYAVEAMPGQAEREAELLTATLWRCLHGKTLPKGQPQKESHKRVLSGPAYIEAMIVADIFCDAAARADASPEVRELVARAFKELAALVNVPAPAFAWTPRAWKQARAAYIEMQRAARLLCEAEGLKDVPHHSSLHQLDPYTHAGRAARIAAWLGFTLWAYHMKDEYGSKLFGPWGNGTRDDRLDQLRSAIEWAGQIERYGAEAVRRAEECHAQMLADALEAARASVPDVATLLRETGAPDVDAALGSELGGEWEKFIAEEGGPA